MRLWAEGVCFLTDLWFDVLKAVMLYVASVTETPSFLTLEELRTCDGSVLFQAFWQGLSELFLMYQN